MENKNAIVVNFISGPGTGKSIISAELFAKLKRAGIKCDVSWEYIKRKLREKAVKVVQSQQYIFGKQQFQLFTMKDEVDVIITDSPLLLNTIYDQSDCPELKALVIKEYKKYKNYLYFIERDESFEYETEGRYQDLDGARLVDNKIKKFLNDNQIPYVSINGIGTENLEMIVNEIKSAIQ